MNVFLPKDTEKLQEKLPVTSVALKYSDLIDCNKKIKNLLTLTTLSSRWIEKSNSSS
jgi:hypothetical protein